MRYTLLLALLVLGCDSQGGLQGSEIEGFVTSRSTEIRYVVNVPEGEGPFPTVAFAPGSGNMPASHRGLVHYANTFLDQGFAVVRYDKRGTGDSGGSVVGVSAENSPETIPILADDLTAVLEAVLRLPEIDKTRVGLKGLSQASWYMPVVMANVPELDFAIYNSAGAVPVGIHLIFETHSLHNGLPLEQATARFEEDLASFDGPLGFDQRPILEAEDSPMLYLMGEKDRNGPYGANRDEINRLASLGVDVTLVSYPLGEHGLDNVDYWPDVWEWLGTKGVLN